MQCHHVPLWGVAGDDYPLLGGLEAAQIYQRFNIVVLCICTSLLRKSQILNFGIDSFFSVSASNSSTYGKKKLSVVIPIVVSIRIDMQQNVRYVAAYSDGYYA